KRLFSTEYETSLWRPVLKRVFPDKTLGRADVAAQLERIYQARNRIAHHEPVYGHRLRDALEAIEFIVTRLGHRESSRATPLAQLLSAEWRSLSAQADDLRTCIARMSAGGMVQIDERVSSLCDTRAYSRKRRAPSAHPLFRAGHTTPA